MIYQTAADKADERRIAAQLGARWRCEPGEVPALSPVDWFMRRGPKLCALVEIKRKRRTFTQYPHVYLDVLKYWPLLSGAVTFSVPSLYVVETLDGLHVVNVHKLLGLTVAVIGRTDRNDPAHDVEPCIAIPLRLFTPVRVDEKKGIVNDQYCLG